MIVGNLFFIKSTSGLFHYGVDYLRASQELIRKILVKPALLAATSAAFPDHEIVVCSIWRMLWEACKAAVKGDVIFTPTSHPLPGLSRQWVVVHDSYPFTSGFKGRLKRRLLCFSLASSACRVAHINQSEVAAFVQELGVEQNRMLFAPNKFPGVVGFRSASVRAPGERLKVALVGTESPKKNYSSLFAAVLSAGSASTFQFHVYGHRNAYLKQLETQFPEIQIHFVASDEFSLPDFLNGVDLLASVAKQEGFGRPIAGALMMGIPCLLLDCPVFREFFDPGAHFCATELALIDKLKQLAAAAALPVSRYCAPAAVLLAYEDAVKVLKADGAMVPA